jgi:hypothetical protein
MEEDLEKLDLACTYLKNDQNTTAHNMFMDLAQKEMEKKTTTKLGCILFWLLNVNLVREKKEKKSYLKLQIFI